MRHVRSVVELTDEEIDRVADTWRARALAARAEGFPYLHAIVNEGRAAGASLAHTHSQLVWLEREPPAVAAERRISGEADGCLVDRLLETERDERVRLVTERGGAVAVAAFAGRQPYELLVAPEACEPDPWTSPALESALRLAVRTLGAIHAEEGTVAANLWLHAGPHWHIEVVPRLTVQAGLELGGEISVNTLAPEDAADRLRARLG